FSANRALRAVERPSASSTSPSLTMPGSSGAIAVRLTARDPLALTSVAAMLPVSMSRPTMDWGFLLVVNIGWSVGSLSGCPALHRLREPASPYPRLMNVGSWLGGRLADEVVQVGIDHLATGEQPNDASNCQEGPEWDGVLARL